MLIVIANQFVGDKISSGGDVLAMQMVKRYPSSKVLLAPVNIKNAVFDILGTIRFVSTDGTRVYTSASTILGGFRNVFRYLLRSWRTTLWLFRHYEKGDTVYLTGDFFCNTMPVFLLSFFYKDIPVWANFYHRNPRPSERVGNLYFVSFASRLLQTLSLLALRTVAKRVFVLSSIGKHELLQLGYKAEILIVSGAGIDETILGPYRGHQKITRRMVYIGRINVTKGAFDLVQILSLLPRTLRWELFMIGSGSPQDLDYLHSLLVEASLEKRVSVLGYVSEADKYRYLSSSQVLLFPSKEEGFGIAVLEALALGVQVVCYDLDVLRTLFGQYEGVFFADQGNIAQFAWRVQEILDTHTKKIEHTHIPTWDDVYTKQFAILAK